VAWYRSMDHLKDDMGTKTFGLFCEDADDNKDDWRLKIKG